MTRAKLYFKFYLARSYTFNRYLKKRSVVSKTCMYQILTNKKSKVNKSFLKKQFLHVLKMLPHQNIKTLVSQLQALFIRKTSASC